MDTAIYVVIPSYEPTESLLQLCHSLIRKKMNRIIIVDDGSGEEFQDIFVSLEHLGITVLHHAVNLGKGRALKTAFNYLLVHDPCLAGVVTADSDGQHAPEDIQKCMDALLGFPGHLILGCRNFKEPGVPWKSRFGNELTKKVLAFLCGVDVSDTQTGLRGIHRELMQKMVSVPGEGFDYETNMLLECARDIPVHEVLIQTIYDSKTDHKTHFDPLLDSIMIYRVILKYSLSSVAATIIDFIIFTIAMGFGFGVWKATALSRSASALLNFSLNKKVVFHAKGHAYKQFLQYLVLVLFSGTISAFLVSSLIKYISIDVLAIKALVESTLFFANYYIQRVAIFSSKKD